MGYRWARLAEWCRLSESVRKFTWQADPDFCWKPGQYVEFVAPATKTKHYYSIASAQDVSRRGVFEIVASCTSRTAFINNLEPGMACEFGEPRGEFVRRGVWHNHALMVGCGTGIAPLRAMIQDWAASRETANVTLLFGCKSWRDLLFREEFFSLTTHKLFRFEPTLSRPEGSWPGRRGYVQDHIGELLREVHNPEVYVCGKREMVRDIIATSTRAGLSRQRVFHDGVAT